MSSNLKRRHSTWYARVGVNPKHRALLGKSEVVRSLKTTDRREAERLKYSVIAEIKAEIDREVREGGATVGEPAWLLQIARTLRKQVASGEMNTDDASELLAVMRDKQHAAAGISEGEVPETSRIATRMVNDIAYLPLSEAVRDYLASIESRIRKTTWSQKQRQLQAFLKWAGDIPVSTVDRRLAGKYAVEVLAKNGLATRTNTGILAVLISFYEWLIKRGLYEKLNPFMKHSDVFAGSTRGTADTSYRAWTKDELDALFAYFESQREGTTKHKASVAARISLYSGMRQDEVCSLKLTDVKLDDGFVVISDAKNDNSVRQVPIHPAIKSLIADLHENSTDEYLIDGLKEGGKDSKRSHALGNRFSEVKSELFPKAGRTLAFHGLRSTFITAMERAGIPESTAKLIDGHARQSLSYGLYSKGPGLDALIEAMAMVDPY